MYLQLTTRCNMQCGHCCMACTRKGIDIPLLKALRAVEVAASHDQYLTIGGGEPTLYKDFWRVLAHALRYYSTESLVDNPMVLVVTNGKRKRDAMSLAALGQMGLICATLSQDQWHDPIDPDVVNAYRDRCFRAVIPQQVKDVLWECEGMTSGRIREYWCDCMSGSDSREIRCVDSKVLSRGRGKQISGARDECACDELFVAADCSVWQCGCKTRKLQDKMTYDCIEDLKWEYVHGLCSEHEDFGEELRRLHEYGDLEEAAL